MFFLFGRLTFKAFFRGFFEVLEPWALISTRDLSAAWCKKAERRWTNQGQPMPVLGSAPAWVLIQWTALAFRQDVEVVS